VTDPLRYPFLWRLGLVLLRDLLLQRSRSFHEDARACVALLNPPPEIIHPENIPTVGPALLVTNHYTRPGFPAWWIALGISAATPVEVHWMMTSAWRHLGLLEPLSRWLFPRLAGVYRFTTTPPMPPDPGDVEARARAVRGVLRAARAPGAVIGLAPEGRDHPGGFLGEPASGAGRFIEKLILHCQRIIPIGVYEGEKNLCVNFGPTLQLEIPPGLSADHRDRFVSQQVMRAIARQLPSALRGKYTE